MYLHKHLEYKERLLDGCCKAGGCSEGYRRAGFIVHGVDIESQPHYHYPFTRADIITWLEYNGHLYDVIHVSPPCEAFTSIQEIRVDTEASRAKHEDLIAPLRKLLTQIGKPYIIENVGGAKSKLVKPIILAGTMFGLKVIRNRYFETSFYIPQPFIPEPNGSVNDGQYCGVYGTGGAMWKDKSKTERRQGSRKTKDWQDAMDIHWMSRDEIRKSIPPAYTHWIGLRYFEWKRGELMQQLEMF